MNAKLLGNGAAQPRCGIRAGLGEEADRFLVVAKHRVVGTDHCIALAAFYGIGTSACRLHRVRGMEANLGSAVALLELPAAHTMAQADMQ